MRNTLYDGYEGPILPRQVQLKRLQKVVASELTPIQREILVAYYFRQMTMEQIARERGGMQEHRVPHPPPGGKPGAPVPEILNLQCVCIQPSVDGYRGFLF